MFRLVFGIFESFGGIFVRMLPMVAAALYFSILLRANIEDPIWYMVLLAAFGQPILVVMAIVAFRAALISQDLSEVADFAGLGRALKQLLRGHALYTLMLTSIIAAPLIFATFEILELERVTINNRYDPNEIFEALVAIYNNSTKAFFLIIGSVLLGLGASYMMFGVSVAATCANAAVKGHKHDIIWGLAKKPLHLFVSYVIAMTVALFMWATLSVVILRFIGAGLDMDILVPAYASAVVLCMSAFFSLLAAGGVQAYRSVLEDEHRTRQALHEALRKSNNDDELRAMRQARMR